MILIPGKDLCRGDSWSNINKQFRSSVSKGILGGGRDLSLWGFDFYLLNKELSKEGGKKRTISRCWTESGIAQKLLETQRTNACLCVHKHPPRRTPNAFIWGFLHCCCQSLFTPSLFWPCMTNVQRFGGLQDRSLQQTLSIWPQNLMKTRWNEIFLRRAF